jgi:redox-sensitive bicupin YhaK (pirin superfamily)
MTAGGGILRRKCRKATLQGAHGFQLLSNLPFSLKITAPRYQDIKAAEIAEIVDDDGTRVRVICGEFWGKRGPVEGVAADPRYLDVFVPPGRRKTLPVETERHAFAYVRGARQLPVPRPSRSCSPRRKGMAQALARERTGNRSLVLFDSGDEVTVTAGEEGIRFLLVSGKPIEEPVAWYGPTDERRRSSAERCQAATEVSSQPR